MCADPGVHVFGRKGAAIHVREVIRALAERGVKVELFALSLGGDPPDDLAGVPVHAYADDPIGPLEDRERACLAANDALRVALDRSGPFDLVYERYSMWSYAGMESARERRVPGILEVNSPLIEEQAAHRELHDHAGADRASRRTFLAATAIVAVSRDVARYLEGFPEAGGRVHVIPNGVDPTRFAPDRVPTRPSSGLAFNIGFAGSLKPWHDLPLVLESFALFRKRHSDAHLLVVGEGPERQRLEAETVRRGLDTAVTFVGSVAHEDVPGLLTSMDVAVAPYPADATYFSPLKVYEYMAAGRPIVASHVGQLAELLQDGVDALLVEPDDAKALVTAFERLYANPELRSRLGSSARSHAVKDFTWDSVVDRILALAKLPSRTPEEFA